MKENYLYRLIERTNRKSGRKWYIVEINWFRMVLEHDLEERTSIVDLFGMNRAVSKNSWMYRFKYKSKTEAQRAISFAILKGLL